MAEKAKKPVRRESVRAGLLALPTEGIPRNMGGLLSSYEPTMREKIGNFVYDGARGMGLLSKAQEMRTGAQDMVDFVPGIGDAVGANDMARDYRDGNYGMAALSAIGLLPAFGDVASKAGKKGIRAYHGSPHSFDKFSLDKIGTGEGAQAYGHGLYFADNEGVAKSYRDALANPYESPEAAAKVYLDGAASREEAIAKMSDHARGGMGYSPQEMQNLRAGLQLLKSDKDLSSLKNPGSMYEVNIDANPDDFLDWDKPLSEQPKAVQEMARNADLSKFAPGNRTRRQIEMWRDGTLPNVESSPTGGTLHNALTDYGGDDVSRTSLPAKLASQGIPGIKYLDAGSRNAGDGSRNYVVFDEKLINIVKKYGLAAAISAGVVTREMGQQMQDQGVL